MSNCVAPELNHLSAYLCIYESIYRWAFAAFLRLVPDAKRRLRQMTAMRTFSTLSMADQAGY